MEIPSVAKYWVTKSTFLLAVTQKNQKQKLPSSCPLWPWIDVRRQHIGLNKDRFWQINTFLPPNYSVVNNFPIFFQVKCTLKEFNDFQQYLKRVRLEKKNQDHKRLVRDYVLISCFCFYLFICFSCLFHILFVFMSNPDQRRCWRNSLYHFFYVSLSSLDLIYCGVLYPPGEFGLC